MSKRSEIGHRLQGHLEKHYGVPEAEKNEIKRGGGIDRASIAITYLSGVRQVAERRRAVAEEHLREQGSAASQQDTSEAA